MFEQSPAKPFPGSGPGGTNLTPAEWARKEESRKKAEFKRMSRSSFGSTSSRSSLGSSHAPPRARLSYGFGAAIASNQAFTPAPATLQGIPQFVSAPGGRSRSGAAASSGTESATAFSGGGALADRTNIDPEKRAEVERRGVAKRAAEKQREDEINCIVEKELAGIPASEWAAPGYDEDVPPGSSSSPPRKKPALGGGIPGPAFADPFAAGPPPSSNPFVCEPVGSGTALAAVPSGNAGAAPAAAPSGNAVVGSGAAAPAAVPSGPNAVVSSATADPDPVAPSENPKPITHNQMAFTFHKHTVTRGTRFRCSKARGKGCEGCNAVVYVKTDGSVNATGSHAAGCYRKNGVRVPGAFEQPEELASQPWLGPDVTDEMHQYVTDRCMSPEHCSDVPGLIWKACMAHFREKYGPTFSGMTKNQVDKLVYNTRNAANGGDTIAAIENRYSGSKTTAFLRYSIMFLDPVKNVMQRMMVFSLFQLLAYFNYDNIQLYVDATFSIVPAPFYQCLIIMAYEPTLGIYIPLVWMLMTGKTTECYWQAFHWLTSNFASLKPAYIGVDFELALFKSLLTFFAESDIIGCLFHFKQALRRKMGNLSIPEDEIQFAMRKGVVDLLTVMPPEELPTRGMFFIKTLIAEFVEAKKDFSASQVQASLERWDEFWEYVKSTWLQPDHIKIFNVAHLDDAEIELKNRTNNALERYNRHFNDIVPRHHPNLVVFVKALRDEAEDVILRIKEVRNGHRIVSEADFDRTGSTIEIPEEYDSFLTPAKDSGDADAGKKKKKKGRGGAKRPKGKHG